MSTKNAGRKTRFYGRIRGKKREPGGSLPAPLRAMANPSNGRLRYRSMTIFLVALKPLVSIL
jgi:hypothetical protein